MKTTVIIIAMCVFTWQTSLERTGCYLLQTKSSVAQFSGSNIEFWVG